jgi:Xaa-Pro aminopeptidase
LTAEW